MFLGGVGYTLDTSPEKFGCSSYARAFDSQFLYISARACF